MIALVIGLVVLPLLGAVAHLLGARTRAAGRLTAAGGAGAVGCAVALAVLTTRNGAYQALGGFIYVDPLSAFFAITVAIVVTLAGLGSIGYLQTEQERGELSPVQVKLYVVFFAVFAALMLASLETGSLGLLWVLIEASTLASAVLVALEARSSSFEAAWKYIIISSFGVTIALVGTLFLFYAASSLPLGASQRLSWPVLFTHAHALQHDSLKLGFLLAVVGYGTKVGLAPMHTWLPDAHSEAPSPASAMLSGALLNTGMYAIIRFQAIAGVDLGRYTHRVLLVFGFASIAIGALFMVRSGNFKRLFAYSSIEHMGIIAVALGFGGVLGYYGALLHTLNHAIGKSVLFLCSGEIVLRYRTRVAARVRGLLGAVPLLGVVLLLGSLAIVGSPPFGLFLSEFTIVRAGFASSGPVFAFALLALLVLAFIAFMRTTAEMTVGERVGATADIRLDDREDDGVARAEAVPLRVSSVLPLLAGLVALLVLGVWIPGGLNRLIMHSIGAIR
jgi:hydrogenase-4 component F